jgi:hypothetical protein
MIHNESLWGKVIKEKYKGDPSIEKWIMNERKTCKETRVISKELMKASI